MTRFQCQQIVRALAITESRGALITAAISTCQTKLAASMDLEPPTESTPDERGGH